MGNVLKEFIKMDKPINVIQGNDIRIIIQDDEENLWWESNVKAIKHLIDNLDVSAIKKDTQDCNADVKILILLLDILGNLVNLKIDTFNEEDKNNIEAVYIFLKEALEGNIQII
ncbi:hypothetical protein G9298_30165 (plasmid) [Bacillus thuringiensis]|nr:hypothetical protein G9298_30165 [Bacillus thuringiensis]